ncbi:MAG: ABC-type polysaccharide/polyol phosphate transport system, ATPase component [Chthoniobacteraceae bacterium]|nr:ABC-type polysaccharide/polyol phosphate transport system, ATPase component [Chthoniobacteraceae bacterium]
MSTVLKVENVSKRYQLGEINRRMLYEELQSRWARWRGKPDPNAPVTGDALDANDKDHLWAVRNVSFDVQHGDVLGVIGHNGSGKSTLLKILSQITAPTSGRVLIKGKVASLLEVGTGFHLELTGRDNVFLNGTFLGMTHREVARQFDEIVAFSGVEDFIDTPVKRYSSGMRVRLAFAVAAHLEAQILIIDEVLAVGDAAFQQKCIGKMSEVAQGGRTVLFVSHNAAAVENLCTRGVVMNKGELVFSGTQTEAIAYYSASTAIKTKCLRDRDDRSGSGEVRIVAMELRDPSGRLRHNANAGDDIDLWLYFENSGKRAFPRLNVKLNVTTHLGAPVFTQSNLLAGESFRELPSKGAFVCRIPRLPLPAAVYRISYIVNSEYRRGEKIDAISNALELPVENGKFFPSGEVPAIQAGVCLVPAEWRMESAPMPVQLTAAGVP